jgi:hypothetical protein
MGSISDPATNTITAQFVDSISDPTYGSITKSVAQQLISEALVNLNEDGITGTTSVTEWTNSGTGGSAYDLDTIVGTGANLKPHPSGSCLLYGTSADFVTTPDSAALDISGDIDFRVDVALDDWVTALKDQGLIGKWNTIRSYAFRVDNSGNGFLEVFLRSTSGNVIFVSNAAPSVADGGRIWVRATVDVDNGSGGADCTFFTSSDGVTWNQLGDVQTFGSTITIQDDGEPLAVGAFNASGSNPAQGVIYRAQLYDGIDGTLVADFNPPDAGNTGATSFDSASTGETWTLNGNSFIQNTGHTVVHSIGSVGIETTTGQTISNPFASFLVARWAGTPSANAYAHDSKSAAGERCIVGTQNSASDNFFLAQGGTNLALSSSFDNSPHVFTGQWAGDASTKFTASDIGTNTGDAGSQDWDFTTLFADRSGTSTMQGYIATLIVFDRALEDQEVSAIQSYLESLYSL